MSILNRLSEYLCDFVDLLFPPTCPVCNRPLTKGQRYICTACRLDIPLTGYQLKSDNAMAEMVRNIRPDIKEATALIFYMRHSGWQRMIHDFKYRDMWYHGQFMGDWLGRELADSELYRDIDIVVAVPLHIRRLISRGYNQSDYIARGVAHRIGAKHITGAVKRTRYNKAQAKKRLHERWSGVEGLFKVTDSKLFEGRSILLIDDVFTSGATIMSCAEAILEAAPTCRLSIATIAIANRISR